MDPNYEFDAPMYVDFKNALPDDGVDSWFDSRAGDEGGIVMEADSLEETSEEERVQTDSFAVHDKTKSEETVKTSENTAVPSTEETFKDNENERENLPDNNRSKKTVDQAPEIVKPVRNLPNICASTDEWRQKTKNLRKVGGSNQPLKANHSLQIKQTVKSKQVDEQQKEKQASKVDDTTKKSNDIGSRPVLKPKRSARILAKRDPSPCTGSRKRDPSPCTSSRKRDPSPCTSSRKRDPSPCTSSRKRDPSPCTSSRSRKRDPSPCTSSRKHDPSPCINSKKRDPSPCPSQRGRQPSPTLKSRSRQPSPCSASRSQQLSTCSNTSVSSSSGSSPKKRKTSNANKSLTIPTSPSMMRRSYNKPANNSHKSKEDEELEIIAKLQKETKKKIEKNEQFMKKALSSQPYMPHRSAEDNFTFPEEFHFATDERIKNAPKQEEKKKDFAETLRQHPPSPTFKNRGPTVPIPFHFHATSSDSHKRKLDEEDEKAANSYLTMAQQVYNFHSNTPERFRTRSFKDQNEGPVAAQNKAPLKLTNPKTPKLLSKERKRPLPDDVLSREQEEEKIAEEIKNYKFKASKFDPRIIETNGCYGIKTVPKKPLTEPEPFSFEYDERAEQHKQKEQMQANEPKAEPFKANPVPDYDKVAFKPELKRKATEAEPFSFEERNKEMLVKKEQKIQAIIQEEKNKANEFEAQPLPEFSPPKLRSSTKVLTEPTPFHLSCDYKGAAKAEKWMQKVRDELKDQRMKAVFKAHPSNVLYNAPFVPKKSLKPCTEFEEFDLNTERRREAREIYEMAKKEQAKAAEAEALQREKEREEEERITLIELRKQLVHKPNPIRKFKGVKVQPSQQPLTVPESPDWSERSRKKMRL